MFSKNDPSLIASQVGSAPYTGPLPFISVICHSSDASIVAPFIKSLDRLGYRVWFDKSGSVSSCLNKFDESVLCIAFVSKKFGKDRNLCDEYTYAALGDTPVITVLVGIDSAPPKLEGLIKVASVINCNPGDDISSLINKVLSMSSPYMSQAK